MTYQYKDLKENVSIEIKPEDKRLALVHRILLFTSLGMICGLWILAIILNVFFFIEIKGIKFITCTFLFFYIISQIKIGNRTRNILFKKCDPVGRLSILMAIFKYAPVSANKWEVCFSNFGGTLFYAGRFDDAEKVAQLMDKYCDSNSGKIRATLIRAKIAYAQENTSRTIECATTLYNLAYKTATQKGLQELVREVQFYPIYLGLKQAKQYQNMYNLYRGVSPMESSRLSNVQKNYYMYEASKLAGNIDVAKEHKEYVLKYGGTTWYRTKIMQIE